MKKIYSKLLKATTKKFQVLTLLFLILIGLIIRFQPGKNQFLWNTSDYPRDAYLMRKMVQNQDLILIGPRAEIFDPISQGYFVFHGPLYYYLLAPFYFMSHGDPNLPLSFNILIHISALIPIWLLTKKITPNKFAPLIIGILWVFSTEQIEYSRWLLNPAMAVPFLAWFIYGLWQMIDQQKYFFLTGLSLGLAIQNEIFLGYLLLSVGFFFLMKKFPMKKAILFISGLSLGLSPLILAEIKFKFRMSHSLFRYVYFGGADELSWFTKISRLVDHLLVVGKHNLFGFSGLLSLLFFFFALFYLTKKTKNTKIVNFVFLASVLFSAHLLLFFTSFQNSIYIDLGLGLIFLITSGILLAELKCFPAILLMLLIIGSQLQLNYQHQQTQLPFGGNFFLKSDIMLYQQRLDIAEKIYQLSADNDFSISVLETPYGWPTMWASIFEQLSRQKHYPLPHWYGFYVRGVGGDDIFTTTDQPLVNHFVLYPQTQIIDQTTINQFFTSQNLTSTLIKTYQINNYTIEQRKSK